MAAVGLLYLQCGGRYGACLWEVVSMSNDVQTAGCANSICRMHKTPALH